MEHTPIDRKALVRRHNMRPTDIERIIPLGNGEFCFGCDRTGLQNFGGDAMAHWAGTPSPLLKGSISTTGRKPALFTPAGSPATAATVVPPVGMRTVSLSTAIPMPPTWAGCGLSTLTELR